MGYGYGNQASRIGTFNKASTTVNEEVVVDELFQGKKPTNKSLLKLQLIVDKNCEVLINGRDTLTISPTYGLFIDYNDIDINSLITKTAGVNLYGVYFW